MIFLNSSSPIVEQIPNKNVSLKIHQRAALQKCIDLEQRKYKDTMESCIGIIGDAVGTGKSYIVLSLIQSEYDPPRRTRNIMHSCGDVFTSYMPETRKPGNFNVLVIPFNLVSQWLVYVNEFGRFRYRIIKKRKDLLNFSVENIDILIVTSSFHNDVALLLEHSNIRVKRVIYDEADSIRIPNCVKIHADFHWFVTGSYKKLLYPMHINHRGYIKNEFTALNNRILDSSLESIVVVCDGDFVAQSIKLPPLIRKKIICDEPKCITILNGIVDSRILQFLNAGDTESALSCINGSAKIHKNDVLRTLLNKYEFDMHNVRVTGEAIPNMYFFNEVDKQHAIEMNKKKITVLDEKIQNILERAIQNGVCPLCLENIKENRVIMKCCNQSSCLPCSHTWFKKSYSCPYCRHEICNDQFMVVVDKHPNEKIVYDKNHHLIKLLHERGDNARLLVYANYKNTLDNLCEKLEKASIKFSCLKGNNSVVKNICDNFETGKCRVLLINSEFYGAGLNITSATDIVIYHNMDAELQDQIIGRAYRVGRRTPLNVWDLLYQNENGL